MRKSLTVGLRDTLMDCVQRQQIPVTEAKTEVIQCSEQLPELSDDDVTCLLQGLEETFSATEVEELLKGLEGVSTVNESGELLKGFEETSVINESGDYCLGAEVFGDHYVDDEVRAVMSMNVDDFVV